MNIPVWIDGILGWIPGYKQLKELVTQTIFLIEIAQSQQQINTDKKKAAMDAIMKAIKELGITTNPWINLVISILIDAIVLALNTLYGKDWINKIKV